MHCYHTTNKKGALGAVVAIAQNYVGADLLPPPICWSVRSFLPSMDHPRIVRGVTRLVAVSG